MLRNGRGEFRFRPKIRFLQSRAGVARRQRQAHKRPRRGRDFRQRQVLYFRGTQARRDARQQVCDGRPLLFVRRPIQLEGRGNRPRNERRPRFGNRARHNIGEAESHLQSADEKVRDVDAPRIPQGADREVRRLEGHLRRKSPTTPPPASGSRWPDQYLGAVQVHGAASAPTPANIR